MTKSCWHAPGCSKVGKVSLLPCPNCMAVHQSQQERPVYASRGPTVGGHIKRIPAGRTVVVSLPYYIASCSSSEYIDLVGTQSSSTTTNSVFIKLCDYIPNSRRITELLNQEDPTPLAIMLTITVAGKIKKSLTWSQRFYLGATCSEPLLVCPAAAAGWNNIFTFFGSNIIKTENRCNFTFFPP